MNKEIIKTNTIIISLTEFSDNTSFLDVSCKGVGVHMQLGIYEQLVIDIKNQMLKRFKD